MLLYFIINTRSCNAILLGRVASLSNTISYDFYLYLLGNSLIYIWVNVKRIGCWTFRQQYKISVDAPTVLLVDYRSKE
jgi:hypothetical protein